MPRPAPETIDTSKSLEFLVIDWFECDITNHNVETDEDDGKQETSNFYLNKEHNKEYVIFAFGVTKEGYSVCLRINNYHPYFYINIPNNFTSQNIKEFNTFLDTEIYEEVDQFEHETYSKKDITGQNEIDRLDLEGNSKYYKTSIKNKSTCNKYIFWSFMNEQKFNFIKLECASKISHKFWGRYFLKEHDFKLTKQTSELKLSTYESDLEPLLRFMHDRNIKPCGWIQLQPETYTETSSSMQSSCGINIIANWDKVFPLECNEIPPLVVASFDIEADSSHGDFPIPCKDSKKLANQLVIAWLRDIRIINTSIDKTSKKYLTAAANIASEDTFFQYRILQALNQHHRLPIDYQLDTDIDKIWVKDMDKTLDDIVNQPINFKNKCSEIFNICNHPIRKVKTDTAMKNAVKSVEKEEQEKREKISNLNKEFNKHNTFNIGDLKKIIISVAKKTHIPISELQDKIITKEVMVKFVNQILNGLLGAVVGDPTIQIGTVFWRFGEDLPYLNNIITLKSCSKFKIGDKPCMVLSTDYEEEIYLLWQDLIQKEDPDIIIGYNIFGFDETFIHDRIYDLISYKHKDKLSSKQDGYIRNDMRKFISFGRLSETITRDIKEAKPGIINKQLSSSALGDNFLAFFNMPGRLQMDLLKVFQGDVATKLPSYKLDDVASHFLSGPIKKILITEESQSPASSGSGSGSSSLCAANSSGSGSGSGSSSSSPASSGSSSSTFSNSIIVDNIKEIQEGNYVVISMALTGQKLYDGEKIPVIKIDKPNNILVLDKPVPIECLKTQPVWGLAKDDISPMDIFQLQKQGPKQRAKIAKYCIQDCALLIRLLKKRDIITNIFGMANVCIVPASYIIFRGQGIKIFSLVVNECAQKNYVLPVLEKVQPEEKELEHTPGKYNSKQFQNASTTEGGGASNDDTGYDGDAGDDNDGDEIDNEVIPSFNLQSNFNVIMMNDDSYEGAIVLNPKPNIYSDPITVMDFGSLYPSEMIASNLSHDCICDDPYWHGDEGADRIRKLGYDFLDRSYDNYTWVDPNNKNKGKKKDGVVSVRYIQYKDTIDFNGKKEIRKGLLPQILQKLLDARKKYKNMAAAEPDKNKAAVLDGLQLAYKITANSLYGQVGAKTSKIYKPQIAASTTAGGRGRIIHARDFVLNHFPGSEVVYGDTDSIFIKFDLRNKDGSRPSGREAIELAIKMGKEAEAMIKKELPPPHKLNYEKVFYPFILITKKRYIGIKYEEDPDKGKNTSMGVVTKRRDNAPILKHTFTGVIDVLMKERDINKAIKFIQKTCIDMIEGKFDLNMFVISKTLNAYYKDPESIAHKVLADRMAERDPGNKPAINERIPFIFIKIEEKPGVEYLQGDRIEHVSFVRSNNCSVDYEVYITNQIMKPVSQILELVVEQLPKYPYRMGHLQDLEIDYYNKYNGDLVKTAKKLSSEKLKIVKKLVFDPLIQYSIQKIKNTTTLDKWFTKLENIKQEEELLDTKMEEPSIKLIDCDDVKKETTSSISLSNISSSKCTSSIIINKKLKQTDINSWFK